MQEKTHAQCRTSGLHHLAFSKHWHILPPTAPPPTPSRHFCDEIALFKSESLRLNPPFDQCLTNQDKSSALPWRERSVKLNGAVPDTKTPTPSPTLLHVISMATKLCNKTEAWRSEMKYVHSGHIRLRKYSKQDFYYHSSHVFKRVHIIAKSHY